ESAQEMLQAGAHRVELCSNLECGGLTPTWLSRLCDDPSLGTPYSGGPPYQASLSPSSSHQASLSPGSSHQASLSPGGPSRQNAFAPPSDREITAGLSTSDDPLQLSGKSFLDRAHVLIRCRPGDFYYSQAEVDQMCQSIRLCREAGVRGVVIGALTQEGHPDLPALRQMIRAATGLGTLNSSEVLETATNRVSAAYYADRPDTGIATGYRPLRIVFHRAFDECTDSLGTLEQIINLGFHTLLTSGHAPTAEEGISLLKQLVDKAAGRITIMAGKGVNINNVAKIVEQTRVPAIHLSERPGISEILRHLSILK
ncbi:MAG: copper homeostasis protein CutC, partial [Proteiniphilum sp.]|nr:copper homeostasis protein CutC [Proteiniphilum sp.]